MPGRTPVPFAEMEPLRHLVRRLRALPDWAGDTALAVTLAAVEASYQWLLVPADVAGFPNYRGPGTVSVIMALAVSLPLAFRRQAPLGVMTVIGLSSVAAIPLGVPLSGLGLVVALYTVAAYTARRDSLVVLAVFAVFSLLALVLADTLRFAALNAVIFVSAWVLGDRMQARRQYTAELERRAEHLERDRENRAALAVAAERQRIARELHDVVAHSVSVMVVQTTAARRVLASRPERAAEAMAQVEATGRQSLVELRRILGVLRAEVEAGPVLTPQPRLEFLDDLVMQFRATGMPVEVRVDGTPRSLASGVDLSAYRIVQEALTNVLKHAGDARAVVHVTYGADELVLCISDDGRGPRPGSAENGSGGHGLVGMRERVTLLGGELRVGPRGGGGFEVRAALPLEVGLAVS
jgi:signal transduction histidine kinase